MDESAPVVAEAPPRAPQGWPVLAWCVILLSVGFMLWLPSRERHAAPASRSAGSEVPAVFSLQARYLIGIGSWAKQDKQAKQVKEQVYQSTRRMLDAGSFWQRLGFVVLTGELAGPSQALEHLTRIDQQTEEHGIALTPEQSQIQVILESLYHDYDQGKWDAPSLTADHQSELRRRLGWLGQLALAPAAGPDQTARQGVVGSAQRLVAMLVGSLVLLMVSGAAGLLGLIVFLVLLGAGKISGSLVTGTGHGGIYAETFALWLVLFGGLSIAAALVPSSLPRLLLLPAVMFLSLAALAWPVARGIAWREVRREIGWTAGRAPLVEPLIGVASYAMGLPLLAIGLLITAALILLQNSFAIPGGEPFGPAPTPTHPIVDMLAQAGAWGRLQLIFLAAVAAPIVEETMFRGVLYRHLREASARLSVAASVIVSGTITSFLFAVIHPQGIVTVPALMALAYTFTAAREWRGTLIPAMVAHGIQNGLLMVMLMFVL